MINNFCERYGKEIGTIDEKIYHAFPTIECLLHDSLETELRDLGFGYRAKYIANSMHIIKENGGIDWLFSLRSLTYPETKAKLLKLTGGIHLFSTNHNKLDLKLRIVYV